MPSTPPSSQNEKPASVDGTGMLLDVRAWLAIGLYVQSLLIGWALYEKPELAEVKLFELLAQAIVMQGFLGLILAFFFTASKSGTDIREQVGKAMDLASSAVAALPASPPSAPQKVNLEGTITSAPDRAEFETDSGYRPLASTSDDPPVVPSLGGSGQRPDGATTAMDE